MTLSHMCTQQFCSSTPADMALPCCLCVAMAMAIACKWPWQRAPGLRLTFAHVSVCFLDLQAVIAGAIQHNAELVTARGGKAPPGKPNRKCSCCALQ